MVLYSLADQMLHATTINHRHGKRMLATAAAAERLSVLCFSASGETLLTAGDMGTVCLRSAFDLSVVHELSAATQAGPGGAGPLRCLALSRAEDFLLAGTQQGKLLVWSTSGATHTL